LELAHFLEQKIFGGPINKRRSENLAQLMLHDDKLDWPESGLGLTVKK
jgi:hypothetical protein